MHPNTKAMNSFKSIFNAGNINHIVEESET